MNSNHIKNKIKIQHIRYVQYFLTNKILIYINYKKQEEDIIGEEI